MNESPNHDVTFEQALAALEKIVRELEDGQTGLEESLACYEKGVGLLKCCYQQLSQAEQRIVVVTGEDESGKPLTKPFKHAATAEKERESPPAFKHAAIAEKERDKEPPPASRRKRPDEMESLF